MIKRLNQLYRQPTIENLKLMMDIFVFDTSDLTDALFEARLNNMLSRRDHWKTSLRGTEANPKQFPDFGPRLAEIKAQTLIVWGRNDRFVPMDAGLRLLSGIAGSELAYLPRLWSLGAVGTCRRFQSTGAEFPRTPLRNGHDEAYS